MPEKAKKGLTITVSPLAERKFKVYRCDFAGFGLTSCSYRPLYAQHRSIGERPFCSFIVP